MSILQIKNLHVSVETDQGPKQILRGVDLTIRNGETHAIMGPNGSGKSTLAYSIAGHPKYEVTEGEILLDGENVLEMSVDERARAGLFLAMQYPVEIPGVSVSNFLRTAKTAISGEAPSIRGWVKEVRESMDALRMDSAFTERNVNEGFSGGEKKRHEILQLSLLKPKFAVLDETDSGLDVDALKTVSEGVNRAKEANDLGVLLITHYTRILKYIQPDFVHVFVAGQVAEQGGPELWAQPLAALVQPWHLELVSLTDRVPGWDSAAPGMDLLQETRGDQPGLAAGAADWQPPLRRGAAIGAALVGAMALVAGGLVAIQVGNQAEIDRLLPVQALADGLQARLQSERRRLRLLQRLQQQHPPPSPSRASSPSPANRRLQARTFTVTLLA